MTINTHCLPNGSLGTNQIPVSSVPGPLSQYVPTGSKRGVVVWMHGLSVTGDAYPFPILDQDVGGFAPVLVQTFVNDLVADGWVVVPVTYPEDGYAKVQVHLVYMNDINSDTGSGSRFLTTTLHWWDHVVEWIHMNYGVWPIVPFGVSWGGYHSLVIAANKTSTIAAYGAQVPATILSAANPIYTPPQSFSVSPVTTTLSSGVTLPASTISVNSTTGFASSGTAVISGSNGTQWFPFTYSNKTTNTFTGCAGGTGTMTSGWTVEQSTFTSGLDLNANSLNGITIPGYMCWETGDFAVGYALQQLIASTANANGASITTNPVSGGTHQFNPQDVTAAKNWFTSTVDPLCPTNILVIMF